MSKWIEYEWIDDRPIAWKCGECGEVVSCQYNFCPECGDPKTSKGESINKLLKALETEHKKLREMQNAQPEIIRCKDCKHRMPYDWMFSETWQSQNIDDYPEDEIGCMYCDMTTKADDFCSHAERRTDG